MNFVLLSLAIVLAATPAARAQTPPASPSLAEMADASPAVAAALDLDRSTAAGKLRAVITLLDLGAPAAAAQVLPELLQENLDADARAELVREFGLAPFLKLIRLDRPGDSAFAGARNFAQGCLDDAAEQARDPRRIAELVTELKSNDQATRSAAMIDLRGRGEAAIAALLTTLAETEDESIRRSILQTLGEMRPALDGPLVAGLAEGSGQFQRDLADLAVQLNVSEAALWLAALSAAEPPTAAGAAVRAMIVRRGLAPSTPAEVAAAVRRRLAELHAGAPLASLDAEGRTTWWSWNRQTKQLASRQASADELKVLAGARLLEAAEAAEALDPELKRQLASCRLERAALLGEKPPAATLRAIERLSTAEASELLAEAVHREHYAAAIQIAAELGRRKDFAALVTADGRPSPLAAAAASPRRALRYAALEAIMAINPPASFAGASYVSEALWQFAAGGGRPAAIVASSRLGLATIWAGQLRGAGYDAEPLQTGLDAVRLAIEPRFAGRLALVVFDSDLGSPGVGELIYQLRTHPSARHVPVAVLSSIYRLADAERWAAADGRALAILRPVDAAGMKAIADEASEMAEPLPPEEQREAQAAQALKWLAERLAAGVPYGELAREAKIAERLLLTTDLTAPALLVLERIGTRDSQAALVEAASNAALPSAARTAAVDALAKNLAAHPLQLNRAQVLLQYDRYNASETAEPETQEILGRILDLIERK